MRIAIISDIHSNSEALHAAGDYIRSEGIERTICLGDIVGYGAEPNECCEWIRENVDLALWGIMTPPSLESWTPITTTMQRERHCSGLDANSPRRILSGSTAFHTPTVQGTSVFFTRPLSFQAAFITSSVPEMRRNISGF